MGSFATTVPLVLFLLLLTQGEAVSKTVITTICPKTMDPAFCLKTLKSEPRATAAADLPCLASLIAELAEEKAKATLDLFTAALEKHPPVGPTLIPIYKKCVKAYARSIDNLTKAKPNIDSKNFQLLADLVNTALKGAEDCEDSMKGAQAAPEIEASNQETLKLCNMVFTCSDNLLG